MNKCLVTKLKAVVNNPNLKKIGIIEMKIVDVSTEDKRRIHVEWDNSSEDHIIKTLEGNSFFDANGNDLGNSIVVKDSLSHAYSVNELCTVIVNDKYNLKSFFSKGGGQINVSDFDYCSKITQIWAAAGKCTGSLFDLGTCISVTLMNLYSLTPDKFSQKDEDLLTMIKEMVKYGKTSCEKLQIWADSSKIFLDGNFIPKNRLWFYWNDTTTLYCKDLDTEEPLGTYSLS